jgi:hypothetical protein
MTTSARPIAGDRCLSVAQYWASLIFARDGDGRPAKPVENRTWSTRYRGRLVVHASLSAAARDQYDRFERGWLARQGVELPAWAELPRGVLLGVVELADCLPVERLPKELRDHPTAEGPWCWVLAGATLFDGPVPAKGALSLWTWPG